MGGALIGGAIGAVAGGIRGGLKAQKDGLSFWKGIGHKTTAITLPLPATASNSQYGNNAEMRTDYDTNIGSVDGMTLEDIEDKLDTDVFLGTDKNLNPGYYLDSNGMITDGKDIIGGYTTGFKDEWFGKLTSQITISPGVKGFELAIKNMIYKHEFMHAWHWQSGFSNFYRYTERATSKYSSEYAKIYNFPYTPAATGYYPPEYSWKNFSKVIKP